MTAVKRDIYIEQGATFFLRFQWCEKGPVVDGVVTAGPPKDLTGWVARMQVRKIQQSTVLVDATTENGMITLGDVDPADGWVMVEIPDEATELINVKRAKYDLELEDPEGHTYRRLQGRVTTDPNYTQDDGELVVRG